jgi:hypothetical protein
MARFIIVVADKRLHEGEERQRNSMVVQFIMLSKRPTLKKAERCLLNET